MTQIRRDLFHYSIYQWLKYRFTFQTYYRSIVDTAGRIQHGAGHLK